MPQGGGDMGRLLDSLTFFMIFLDSYSFFLVILLECLVLDKSHYRLSGPNKLSGK